MNCSIQFIIVLSAISAYLERMINVKKDYLQMVRDIHEMCLHRFNAYEIACDGCPLCIKIDAYDTGATVQYICRVGSSEYPDEWEIN